MRELSAPSSPTTPSGPVEEASPVKVPPPVQSEAPPAEKDPAPLSSMAPKLQAKEKSRGHIPSPLSRDRVDALPEDRVVSGPMSPVIEARTYVVDAEDALAYSHPRRLSVQKKSASIGDLSSIEDDPGPLTKPPPLRSPQQRVQANEARTSSESGIRVPKAPPKPSLHLASTSLSMISDSTEVILDPRGATSPTIDQSLRERTRKLSMHLNKNDVTNEITEVAQETLELLDQFDAIFQDALTAI